LHIPFIIPYFDAMKKILILFILYGISAVTVSGQQVLDRILNKEVLRIGLSGDQPPFAMEAIDGSLIGFEVDLAHLLADAMDVEPELVQMPFKDLLPALEKGDIDVVMSGMTMTIPRNMKYAFAGPYVITGKSVLSRSKSYSKDNIYELNTKNITIATLNGSTSKAYAIARFPEAIHVYVTNYAQAVQMLRNNEVNALVADYMQCTYIAYKNSTDRFYVMPGMLTTERIGLAVSPTDPLFINLLTNFLDELTDSGQLNELENKWIRSLDWMSRVE